jgi:hypothetical protein
VENEEGRGPEQWLPGVVRENMPPIPDNTVQTGRVREPGGASFFVWQLRANPQDLVNTADTFWHESWVPF